MYHYIVSRQQDLLSDIIDRLRSGDVTNLAIDPRAYNSISSSSRQPSAKSIGSRRRSSSVRPSTAPGRHHGFRQHRPTWSTLPSASQLPAFNNLANGRYLTTGTEASVEEPSASFPQSQPRLALTEGASSQPFRPSVNNAKVLARVRPFLPSGMPLVPVFEAVYATKFLPLQPQF